MVESPLTDKMQAFLVAFSVFLLTLGTATVTIPEFVPSQYRVPFAVFFWICGIVGLALKEALGTVPPNR